MPSSDQITSTSIPAVSRSLVVRAIAHGACTLAPSGESMTIRQSPISSRKRSTTIVWSEGRAPVAVALFLQISHEIGRRQLVEPELVDETPSRIVRGERPRSL